MTSLTMKCAGCGATIALDDPTFADWWQKHGRCLREKYTSDPPPEINRTVYELLRERRGA